MIRKDIFNYLKDKLALIGESGQLKQSDSEASYFKTFKLYNRQVEFAEQGEIFDVPAVFVEFQPIKHAKTMNRYQHQMQVNIHFVDEYTTDEHELDKYDLLDTIERFLYSPQYPFIKVESDTNTNHEQLVEDIEIYQLQLLK